MIPAIEAVFFDLDGTLVDSAPGIEYAALTAWAIARPGLPCPPIRPLMGPPVRQMFRLALPEAEEEVIHALEQQFRMAYDRDGWTRTVVFPGVLETLDELKTLGVRCFGVTNKPGEVTQKVLGHCRLVGRFEGFISPDSSQPAFSSKADATRWLLAENQIDPHTACFVGDTVEDARAAQACGMRFIAFSCGYGWSGLRTQMGGLVSFSEFSALAGLLRDRYWSE